MKKIALGDLCNLEKGKTGLLEAKEGEYILVATGKDRRTCETYQFDTKAVCIPLVSSTGHGHASLKYVHYQEGKFALGTILVAVIPKDENVLNAQFLHLYLSRLKDVILVPLMTGAANVTLTITKLKTVKIPLPPIDEQLRIVSLFNCIDKEQTELIGEVSNQQKLLKKLRQSILQDAIEGKLTKKWREENLHVESASILLEKIQAEKEKLIQEKKIKKQEPLTKISEDEIPFNIPQNWAWCRLGHIFDFIDYRGKTPNKITEGIRLITARNIKNGYLSIEPEDFISYEEFKERMTRGFPKKGDILFTTEAPLGNIAILNLDEPISTGQRLITLKSYIDSLNNLNLMYFMLSNFFQQYLIKNSTGVTAKGIKTSKLITLLIPLPPFEEQKAIVAKIEKLFTTCNKLESEINQNKTTVDNLMATVLKEAFEN